MLNLREGLIKFKRQDFQKHKNLFCKLKDVKNRIRSS